MTGLGVAGSYFPHMMSVRSGKFRTPLEVFKDDGLLAKAIESRIIADGKAIRPARGTSSPSGLDPGIGVPADLNHKESDAGVSTDMDELLWFAGLWWWFPTASADLESAEFEWRNGRAYLLKTDGSAVEGIVFAGEVVPD